MNTKHYTFSFLIHEIIAKEMKSWSQNKPEHPTLPTVTILMSHNPRIPFSTKRSSAAWARCVRMFFCCDIRTTACWHIPVHLQDNAAESSPCDTEDALQATWVLPSKKTCKLRETKGRESWQRRNHILVSKATRDNTKWKAIQTQSSNGEWRKWLNLSWRYLRYLRYLQSCDTGPTWIMYSLQVRGCFPSQVYLCTLSFPDRFTSGALHSLLTVYSVSQRSAVLQQPPTPWMSPLEPAAHTWHWSQDSGAK